MYKSGWAFLRPAFYFKDCVRTRPNEVKSSNHLYIVEFKYVQNPRAKKPIILIDQYIGTDSKGVTGIDGGRFTREVLALKNSGVTEAEVWINSKGGEWSQGVSIVGAMRNSGIDFTTVNMGFVDSTAGHIFQAGKHRKWMDYAVGLVHNIQGNGSDTIMEAMNNSVATLLQPKTNRTVDQVRELMNAETILTTKTAGDYGFYDEKIDCTDILSFTNSSDPVEVTNVGAQQIKKLLPKVKNMEAVNAVLGLTNEASEAAQLAAINSIIKAKNDAEATILTVTNERDTAVATLTETNTKLATAENAILAATNEAKKTKAEALVALHTGKRIVDTPENVLRFTNLAIADYEGTKAIIEAINLNVTAPKPVPTGATAKVVVSAAQYTMQ